MHDAAMRRRGAPLRVGEVPVQQRAPCGKKKDVGIFCPPTLLAQPTLRNTRRHHGSRNRSRSSRYDVVAGTFRLEPLGEIFHG